jgi:cytidyltransferase-like protein
MRALLLGSFDILHWGHIDTINQAARLGDVIIGLGTDEYQRIYKHEPVLSFEERKQQLEGLGNVSLVVARPYIDARPLFEAHKPDFFVAGMDWFDTPGAPHLEMSGIDKDFLNDHGITLVYQPRGHNWSTSEIIRRIRGEVAV